MHALITADTVGGVWTYVRELVTALSRQGVRVTLVSFGEIPTSTQTAWLDPLENVDFRPTAFRLEWMQDAVSDVRASSEYLAAIVQEVKPDLLHLNQYCYGDLHVDVPRLVVAHSDVVSWWVAVHGHEPPFSKWMDWYRATLTAGVKGADVVVAPSKWMLQAVSTYYSLPARAQVIHNGRNPSLFNPVISKEPYMLSVGRLWDEGKQISLLRQISSPVPVYIAGSTEHPDRASHSPRARSAASKLHFKGPQSEAQLCKLYSRASIYAAVSCYEPFGLALVEAALSRCAIVANDIPSFREIWGDTVAYFRTNDPDSLTEVINRIANDESLRTHYARASYDHAVAHYSADRMAGIYISLYRSLVAAEATAA